MNSLVDSGADIRTMSKKWGTSVDQGSKGLRWNYIVLPPFVIIIIAQRMLQGATTYLLDHHHQHPQSKGLIPKLVHNGLLRACPSIVRARVARKGIITF